MFVEPEFRNYIPVLNRIADYVINRLSVSKICFLRSLMQRPPAVPRPELEQAEPLPKKLRVDM
jgi:hypothetical protein